MKKIFILTAILASMVPAIAQTTDTPSQPRMRKGAQGIIILGDSCNVRAFSPFNGGSECMVDYAQVANEYYRNFEGKVNIYCMPVPTAAAFYGGDQIADVNRSQAKAIDKCFLALDKNVHGVALIPELTKHASEDIYSRTDHHWAPLGAYYAAQQFARAAGVPFKDLSHYDKRVVRDFVGTMYRFSKCIDIKNNPEDFYYYVPKGVDYTTTYIEYTLDKSRRNVVKAGTLHEGEFFWSYKDGSGLAYCTFMGGDTKLTHVSTSTKNGRKLLILKDSFGNAIPGYLFYSFEDIHVVDCRYFTLNLTNYVKENGITDILFCNNSAHAATARTTKYLRNYLVQ